MPAITGSATSADELLRRILTEKAMVTLRARAEQCRVAHSRTAHLGADHYAEAIVELGWPDEVFTKLLDLIKKPEAGASAKP